MKFSEKRINKIITETINNFLKEGLYDPEDDNEIYDIGKTSNYRVKWNFNKKVGFRNYETVSEGEEYFNSLPDARKFFKSLENKFKKERVYAIKFIIEKEIDSLRGNRWENIYNASNKYVGDKDR